MNSQLKAACVFLPVGVLLGLIPTLALTSVAEDTELDTGPRAIPYNGVIELNGQAVQEQVDLQFTLTDAPDGEEGDCLFEEEHDDVTVYSGRFSVNIGAVAGDLPDCVFDSDAMYIEIGVRDGASVGDYVALSGSQRIHPTPFAYWAAEGSDLKVDGALRVSGDANGTLRDSTDGTVSVNADLAVVGDVKPSANGAVTVGDDLDVRGQVYLLDDSDASLALDGLLTLGLNSGLNLTLDADEIIARANGANGTLYLQESGGEVEARGDLGVHGVLRDANDDVLNVAGGVGVRGNIRDTSDDTVTVRGDLDVEGQLLINDLDINDDGSDGCARIGEMQICWENFSNTSGNNGSDVTFRWSRPFLNSKYSVTARVTRANRNVENIVVYDKAADLVDVSCYRFLNSSVTSCPSSSASNPIQISLLAIGRAGDGW